MDKFSIFDELRSYFEPALIYFFLISAVAYIIYKASFGKEIEQSIKSGIASLGKTTRKQRKNLTNNVIEQKLTNVWRKTVFFFADLFWILLVVVVLRSFIVEPFIIPSASMYPGLIESDVVAVNKSAYGIRIPLTDIVLARKSVTRGDVTVFKYPKNEKINYIKRIVGVPGDHISYSRKEFTINGKPVSLTKEQTVKLASGEMADIFSEDLLGRKHLLQHIDSRPTLKTVDFIVPKGQYFAMGDNRDNSEDGRFWGFVPENNVLGRAYKVILNFDCLKGKGNGTCDRFFKTIE